MRSSVLVRRSYHSLFILIIFKDFEINRLMILLGLNWARVNLLAGINGLGLPLLLFYDDFKVLAALRAIEKEAVSIILLIILVIINILLMGELYLKRHGRSHLDWFPVEHRIFRALSNSEGTFTLP
jgi:hypothetical protein